MTALQVNQEDESIKELFGDVETRWYQMAALHRVEDALRDGFKRILVVAPTGAGKTITSGLIFSSPEIRKILKVPANRKLRLLFIAHKHRLLSQAEKAYADASGIELIVQSAFSAIPEKVMKEGWDITCIDEAHHEAMATIQYRLEQLIEHPIIGLTATQDRADGCLIKFEIIIETITRQQAVEEGFLAETDLRSFIDTPKKDKIDIITDIYDNFGDQFGQTMTFVRTKAEVAAVTRMLVANGEIAVGILNQSEKELDRLLDQFSEGKVKWLINCNKINEGVDVQGCTDVLLGRQFGSYPQLNQVIGRASRPDSECRVWELINPLSGSNLDTTVVVGEPKSHYLYSKRKGAWERREFHYGTSQRAIKSGIQPRFS